MQLGVVSVTQPVRPTAVSVDPVSRPQPLHHHNARQDAKKLSEQETVTLPAPHTIVSAESVYHHPKPLHSHHNAHQDAEKPSSKVSVTQVAVLTPLSVDHVCLAQPHHHHHHHSAH